MPISGPELGHLKICYGLMHVNYYDYMSDGQFISNIARVEHIGIHVTNTDRTTNT